MNRNNLTIWQQSILAFVILAVVGATAVFTAPSLPVASSYGVATDTNGLLSGSSTNFFVRNSNNLERARSTAPTNNLRTELLSLLALKISPSFSNSIAVMEKTNGLVWTQSGYDTTIADSRTLANILAYNSTSGVMTISPALIALSATFSGSVTAGGFTSTGAVNRMTWTGTNGLNTQIGSDNATSDNLTNWVGLYYFPSGGTNQADFNRFNQFILTNNLSTNLTMLLTNGAPGRMGRIKILGPTNGNNYTFTLLSAQSWLMEYDRNNTTNGATTITVTNNQSVEFDIAYDKTPTNPVVSLVYSRKTL
jgi:hypothetical protein